MGPEEDKKDREECILDLGMGAGLWDGARTVFPLRYTVSVVNEKIARTSGGR